ncbi:hypothetical protein J6590_056385 [Homalodisca vitripennis]|nr:hypothetical protein J6590_056385 [Homalodisca vitripennis]
MITKPPFRSYCDHDRPRETLTSSMSAKFVLILRTSRIPYCKRGRSPFKPYSVRPRGPLACARI